MKKIHIILGIMAVLAASASAYAQQNLRSGYFLDGYTYRYKFNPAFQGERGYIALPAIGRIGVGVESSIAMSDVVYPLENGSLATFLHPSVPADDFLSGLKDMNRLGVNVDLGILSTGFRTGKSYHTIDVSLRADAGVNLPKDLFAFAKNGASTGQTQYDISNAGARLDSRLEFAYGYSRSIGRNLYAGARIKFLVGIANARIAMQRMSLEMSQDRWALKANGSMTTSGMLAFKTMAEAGTSENASQDNLISFEPDMSMFEAPDAANKIMNGILSFGGALDLGVSWDFCRYFTLSASVLDLGFMSWNNTARAVTPDTAWEFNGFGSNIGEEGAPTLGEQFGTMGEELLQAFNFEREQAGIKSSEALAMTMHLGLEARMPFYEKMSVGLLGTRRFDGAFSWTEGRVSLNLAPLKWLSLTGNYAISDFGQSAGAAINLHVPGFTLCVGADSFLPIMNVAPQFIPIDSWNTNVTFMLCFAFGKYHKMR